MKMNWLMVLPLALTLGFFGVAGMQLMNNQGDLQQGVDTSSLPSAQQGRIAPNLDLEQLDDAVGIGLNEAADADLADAEIKAFEQGIANRGSDDNLNDCACPFLLEALSIELHGR